jgi:hypothetical protein
MIENLLMRGLHGIASGLTSDLDVQKDLMREMLGHFVRVRALTPGQTLSWYFRSCEGHARDYLRLDRNIVPHDEFLTVSNSRSSLDPHPACTSVGAIDLEGQRITGDDLDLFMPLLSDMQQQVLFLLMQGCGVREAGRRLGVTHPAVIKHRKKIGRIAREILQQPAAVAVAAPHGANGNGNGNGEAHSD